MNRKEVLMMCQFFYPEYNTSAILPYQTASALTENDIKVDVITGYPKEYNNSSNVKKKEIINKINIKRVNYLQLSRGSFIARLINYFSFLISMLSQIPYIKNYKILVIYTNPPILPIIAIIANKLFNTRIIFVAYDLYPEVGIRTDKMSEKGLLARVMRAINKRLYSIADTIALSNEMKEFIVDNRKVSPDKVHVINNWATEETDSATITKVQVKKSKTPFIISYLGNMGIPQEFKTLLKAMSSEKIKSMNIEFHFAGHGNKIEKLKQYVEEHKLTNVYFHGYLQNEELDNLVNRTDAFFLSLKNKLNGLAVPSKYYTYLFLRKPILAVINQESDIAKEIKVHKIGYSVEENDVVGLIEAIKKIKTMEYPNEKIYYTNYSKDIQLRKYIDLIENMLDEEGVVNDYI